MAQFNVFFGAIFGIIILSILIAFVADWMQERYYANRKHVKGNLTYGKFDNLFYISSLNEQLHGYAASFGIDSAIQLAEYKDDRGYYILDADLRKWYAKAKVEREVEFRGDYYLVVSVIFEKEGYHYYPFQR